MSFGTQTALAQNLGSATFTAGIRVPRGKFNASVQGFGVATVKLERSFDEGVTYQVVSKDSSGAEASFTANCSLVVEEVEKGVLYRWNCTSWSSGTLACRIAY
jgi:hypothetical protein